MARNRRRHSERDEASFSPISPTKPHATRTISGKELVMQKVARRARQWNDGGVFVAGVTGEKRGRHTRMSVDVGFVTRGAHRPQDVIANQIRDALDPTRAPSKVTSLADMSPEKRAEMERLYGKPKSPR